MQYSWSADQLGLVLRQNSVFGLAIPPSVFLFSVFSVSRWLFLFFPEW